MLPEVPGRRAVPMLKTCLVTLPPIVGSKLSRRSNVVPSLGVLGPPVECDVGGRTGEPTSTDRLSSGSSDSSPSSLASSASPSTAHDSGAIQLADGMALLVSEARRPSPLATVTVTDGLRRPRPGCAEAAPLACAGCCVIQ